MPKMSKRTIISDFFGISFKFWIIRLFWIFAKHKNPEINFFCRDLFCMNKADLFFMHLHKLSPSQSSSPKLCLGFHQMCLHNHSASKCQLSSTFYKHLFRTKVFFAVFSSYMKAEKSCAKLFRTKNSHVRKMLMKLTSNEITVSQRDSENVSGF